METTTHNAQKPETADATSDLRESIRDNADLLEALFSGTAHVDYVTIEGVSAAVSLRDPAAGANLKRLQIRTTGGLSYVRVVNDIGGIAYVPITVNHSTGAVTVPAGKLIADPEDSRLIGAVGQPAYENSWSAGGSAPPLFYKHLGRVHLSGYVTHSGDTAAAAFTLPAGYRPGVSRLFSTFSPAGGSTVAVNADGTVAPATGGGAQQRLGLDGISFRAEA